MSDSTWSRWFSLLQTGVQKRRQRGSRVHGLQVEGLENRALLSASGVVPAEVAHGKALEFPSVAGTWDVSVASTPAGSAMITQNGKSVTAVVSVVGLPQLTLKDKFTKNDPDTLSGKIRIKDVELGKFSINMTVTFGGATGSPTTFTGTAVTPESTVNFTGEKQMSSSLAAPTPRKAPDFEDVTGTWDFTITQAEIGTRTGVLNLTQSGKGGKNLDGTITFTNAPTIGFSAKFEKSDPSTITGTVNIPVPNTNFTVKGKVTAQFNIEFDFFSGSATIKRTTPAEFSATRQV